MSVIGQEKGIRHGTTAGYKQHIYRKVQACAACLEAERTTPSTSKPRAKNEKRSASAEAGFGTVHGDTARESAITYVRYADAQGKAVERRERIKAAITAILAGADDCIDVLGIPDDELALARQVVQRLAGSEAA